MHRITTDELDEAAVALVQAREGLVVVELRSLHGRFSAASAA